MSGAAGGEPGFLLAHIQDVGDVRVGAGERVGDADGRSTIEGFTFSLGSETRNNLVAYQAICADGSLTPRVFGGLFCGTTGCSLPIFGFVVAASDGAEQPLAIEYEGFFQDGSRSGLMAQGMVCRAESGAPLVAMRIGMASPAAGMVAGTLPPATGGRPADASEAALMGRFVSMGGNCEFGLAQRMCGAEPLDLLRWGNTGMGVMLRLLADRFGSLGDPALTRVIPHGNEYLVENSHYRFLWHSWVRIGEMSPERLLRRELARMPRQAEMLIETMAEGRRILVRSADKGTSTAGLAEFVSLIATFGPSQILFVSRDASRAGTVERVGPTLMRGYLERFANPADVVADTRAEPWLELCGRAVKEAVLF